MAESQRRELTPAKVAAAVVVGLVGFWFYLNIVGLLTRPSVESYRRACAGVGVAQITQTLYPGNEVAVCRDGSVVEP